MDANRFSYKTDLALINCLGNAGAQAVRAAYNVNDSSTAKLGMKGSRSLRLFLAWATGVGSAVTTIRIRVNGYGPSPSTSKQNQLLTKKGSDTTQAWVYEHSIATGGASQSGVESFFTDLIQGFEQVEVQVIATGGAIAAGDSVVVDATY